MSWHPKISVDLRSDLSPGCDIYMSFPYTHDIFIARDRRESFLVGVKLHTPLLFSRSHF